MYAQDSGGFEALSYDLFFESQEDIVPVSRCLIIPKVVVKTEDFDFARFEQFNRFTRCSCSHPSFRGFSLIVKPDFAQFKFLADANATAWRHMLI